MMKIIDKYIMYRFLRVFVFVTLLFSLISIGIDFSEKVSKFGETGIGALEILYRYHIGFVMFISSTIWGLYILITSIFLASRLGKNNEILSILNGGISFNRMLRPFVLGASLLAAIHLLGNHFLIPIFDGKRVEFENTELKKGNRKHKNYNLHFMLTPESKVFVRSYNAQDSIAYDVRIEDFGGRGLERIWQIKRMKFVGEPHRWQLYDYYVRHFDGDRERLDFFKNEELDTTYYLSPADFVEEKNEERGYTTPALLKKIRIEKLKGTGREKTLQADFHRRTADAVMDVIMTILAVAIASRKTRGGVGKHLAVGIGIGAGYILLSRMIKFVALASQMPIWLGVWMPNFLFAVVMIYFLTKAQK